MMERAGTGTINILRDYAKTPRVAMIAGKYNRSLMKEFTGDDLTQLSRVVTEVVNPLARTAAGRRELAQDMIQAGLIKRPEEYLSVITTGNLEPLYENEEASLLLIRAENELLTNGQLPVAVITDDHRLHILEHRTVLDSPEARQNPQLVQNATEHLQEHLNLLRTADPALLMLLGQQPVQPPQPHYEALTSSGLPKTPRTIKRMAEVAAVKLEEGAEIDAKTLAAVVREDYLIELKDLLGASDDDALLQLLGDEIGNKVRKADLKRLKTSF